MRRALTLTAIATVCLGLLGGAAAAASRGSLGPYFSAQFVTTRLPFGFGQDASWATDGEVLSAQNDAAGITQIYRARDDGSRQVCLTCRTVAGPNGFPQERPPGDW